MLKIVLSLFFLSLFTVLYQISKIVFSMDIVHIVLPLLLLMFFSFRHDLVQLKIQQHQ